VLIWVLSGSRFETSLAAAMSVESALSPTIGGTVSACAIETLSELAGAWSKLIVCEFRGLKSWPDSAWFVSADTWMPPRMDWIDEKRPSCQLADTVFEKTVTDITTAIKAKKSGDRRLKTARIWGL